MALKGIITTKFGLVLNEAYVKTGPVDLAIKNPATGEGEGFYSLETYVDQNARVGGKAPIRVQKFQMEPGEVEAILAAENVSKGVYSIIKGKTLFPGFQDA